MEKTVRTKDVVWEALKFGGIFAVVLILVLAVLGTGEDAITILSIFATRFLGIFIEAAPFLLLGTLVSGLLETFITPQDIARIVPRNRFLATLMGTFMGFAFPVCECGVVPVARRLFHKGLPTSVVIAFLLAAPVMNPVVFVSTFIAFGWGPILIGRFVITGIVALTVGLIFAVAARSSEVLRPESMMAFSGASPDADDLITIAKPKRSIWKSILDSLQLAGDEFFEMGRYLIIGSLLAAAMQTFVSQDVLLSLGSGPVISVLVMQVMAFVLSVCSTVDAFLALAFTGTFTTGSILAFLSFGPMVDIKSTMMFFGVFKPKIVLYLIILPFLLTLWIGILINLNLAL